MRFHFFLLIACAMLVAQPLLAQPAELPSVFLEDFTSDALHDAIQQGCDRVLVASGSVEASGPHLVLGKHNLRVRAYAERIARELGHTLVAPIIPVAPTSEKLQRFAGTINVRPEIFAQLNEEFVRSLVATGFKYIVLLGDHGAAQEPLQLLAERCDPQFNAAGVRVIFSGDGYKKSEQEIEAYARAHHLDAGGHGGLWDTSELWAIDSAAIRKDRLSLKDSAGVRGYSADVVTGDPRHASAELGRIFADIRIRNAVAEIKAKLATSR